MMKTPVTVFHGTSLSCARSLALDGFENIFELYCMKEFIENSWPIVLDAVGGDYFKTAEIFNTHGAELPTSSPTAIQNIFLGRTGTTYDYGDLFVTTCVHHASGYAKRGPEIVAIISDLWKVIHGINPIVGRELEDQYVNLFKLTENPVYPVVLEISLSCDCHILDERGLSDVTLDDLEKSVKLTRDLSGFRGAFRVRRFKPGMISGYFDLSKASFNPDFFGAGPEYSEKIKSSYISGIPI